MDRPSVTDYFGRNSRRTMTSMAGKENEVSIDTQYAYETLANGNTSELIKAFNNTVAGPGNYTSTLNYTYEYDANGNITQILYNGTAYAKYDYDEANQLIREDNAGAQKTICYAYDNGGNIVSRTEYAYTEGAELGTATGTVNYTYGDNNWKDKLTNYDGKSLTYDAIGNPLTYGEDTTYTWTAGRQLETFENANFKVEYVYNADGLRTRQTIYHKQTVNEEIQYTLYRVYEYVWKDSVVDSEHILAFGDDGQKTNEVVMKIFYDDNQSPLGFTYTDLVENETQTVWYVKNLQGDITALYMEGIGLVMRISYDAWGKAEYAPGDVEGLEGFAYFLAVVLINPNGYRGYCFDTVTNMYYLQSRYYSPVWGRFINEDVYVSTDTGVLGTNMFAYCSSNPITYVDPYGTFKKEVHYSITYENATLFSKTYRTLLAQWCQKTDTDFSPLRFYNSYSQSFHFNININKPWLEDSRDTRFNEMCNKAEEQLKKAAEYNEWRKKIIAGSHEIIPVADPVGQMISCIKLAFRYWGYALHAIQDKVIHCGPKGNMRFPLGGFYHAPRIDGVSFDDPGRKYYYDPKFTCREVAVEGTKLMAIVIRSALRTYDLYEFCR